MTPEPSDETSGVIEASAASLSLLVVVIVGIGWQGAFYRGGQAALGLGVALTVTASFASRRPSRSDLFWPVTVAIAALGGWIVADGVIQGSARGGVAGCALALAVAGTLIVVGRLEHPDRQLLLAALPVVGALAAASAWLGLVLRIDGWSHQSQGLWRAAGTVTYSNGMAAVLVPVAVLAIADTARPVGPHSSDRANRASTPRLVPVATTRLVATLMLAAVLATLSRGGFVSLAVGLALLGALGGRAMLRAAVGPLSGGVIAFLGLVPSLHAETTRRPLPAAAGLLAGLAVAHVVGRFTERGTPIAGRRRPVRLATVAAAGCLVITTAAITVGRQFWAVVEVKFSTGSAYRTEAASAAMSLLRDNPLLGTGPGGAVTTWRDPSGASMTLRYLHNEYLQVLVEYGAVGGCLLLAVLIAGVQSARRPQRLRSETGAPAAGTIDRIRIGGIAAVGAFAVTSALDITWHLPVLPILVATVYALTLSDASPTATSRARQGSAKGSVATRTERRTEERKPPT